ncbi:hypothetical protein ACFLYU_00095 [Candidatus Dependentiae bacterium]
MQIIKKLLSIKLLAVFSFQTFFIPFAHCGRKRNCFYNHNKRKTRRFFKRNKQNLKNRKKIHKKHKEKIKTRRNRKIDQEIFTQSEFLKLLKQNKWLSCLTFISLPSFISTKNNKKGRFIKITTCSHKWKILPKYSGIFWYKFCCIQIKDTKLGRFTGKKYCCRDEPNYCPPNCLNNTGLYCPTPEFPDYIMNCRNGTRVCDIRDCYNCYLKNATTKEKWSLNDWYKIDFNKCNSTKTKLSNKTRKDHKLPDFGSYCTDNNFGIDCSIKQDIASIKWPLITTSGVLTVALIAIILLQTQMCCLIGSEHKKNKKTHLITQDKITNISVKKIRKNKAPGAKPKKKKFKKHKNKRNHKKRKKKKRYNVTVEFNH